MNTVRTMLIVVAAAGLLGCNQANDRSEDQSMDTSKPEENKLEVRHNCPAADAAGVIQIAPGLSATVLKKGYGRAAVTGDYADTNVWLWQYDEAADDRRGEFIWESGNDVFQFQIGSGQVIEGWDMGVPCMLEGETRELVIAPELAYGAAGRGAAIPPNTTLIFTIELMGLTAPE